VKPESNDDFAAEQQGVADNSQPDRQALGAGQGAAFQCSKTLRQMGSRVNLARSIEKLR
jgi:hypothetical protein